MCSSCFSLQFGKNCYLLLLGSSLQITVPRVSPYKSTHVVWTYKCVHSSTMKELSQHINCIDEYLFTVCCLFIFQTMRLLASVLAFETGKMLYKSGIAMHLLPAKRISWGKSTSCSRTYLLKLFFISVSMLISFTLLLD